MNPKSDLIIMNIYLIIRQKKITDCKSISAVKNVSRLLVLLVASLSSLLSLAQHAKGPLQLAEEYFAAGEYYTAANFYNQFLHPPKNQKTISDFPLNIKGRRTAAINTSGSRTEILFKQAESYRLANYWNEAAAAYKECAEVDPIKYADAIYWQAVSERSLGYYSKAEESLKKYASTEGNNNHYKQDAEKELQTLQYIQQQLVRPDTILYKVQKLNAPGSNDKGLFAPARVSENVFLVSSTQPDSVQGNEVNPNKSHLFYATLVNGSLEEMIPVEISGTEPVINQGAASMSADGKYLYITEWKKVNGHTVSSIYYATKQANGWSSLALLPSVNMNGYNSKQPFCSSDGKYLFFSSDRPGGEGKFDIWYAPLNNDGTTGEAVNAGAKINTAGDEQAPFYHNSSNTLVFSSNGKQGMGGYDLFAAKGNETTWELPVNMGNPVNSPRDDIYFFAPEESALLKNAIFSSDRGAGCCIETYTLSKTPKSKRLTGIVTDCKDNTPIAGAAITLKDVSGKSWQATTGSDGQYVFELKNDTYSDLILTVSKELYSDTISSSKIKNADESDFLTDVLTNADLCIEKKPEPAPEPKLVIKVENVVTVFFDFDRSVLKPEAIFKLDSIYNEMINYPTATIQISGYTDGLGSVEYNKILSDKRARACADYLTKKGIDASRITFESFGACCPIEMELINGRDNAEGRSRNRRALINVKKE